MQSGMINKVAITSANVIDSKGFRHVAPNQGAAYADKGYSDKNAKQAALRTRPKSFLTSYFALFLLIF